WEQRDTGTARLAVITGYDALHRAIQKDADTTQAPWFIGTKRQVFEYDGAGRMTRGVDDLDPTDGLLDSEVTLAYNSLSKPISETQIYRASGGVVGTNMVTSTYNGVGFRTSVSYPGLRNVTYFPDEMNRLESVYDSYTAGTTKYDYLGPS